jgi:hypothetical protein
MEGNEAESREDTNKCPSEMEQKTAAAKPQSQQSGLKPA